MTDQSIGSDLNKHNFLKKVFTLDAIVARKPLRYVVFKFVCDNGFAVAVLPFVVCIALVLLVVNPFLNPGPLFYRQERMGMGGRCFTLWKFRTMTCAKTVVRAHDAPLEEERISNFASYLRKLHVDELPNVFNILSGDLSLVGPRPDAWSHSSQYIKNILNYSDRFQVRPGITGLAQVQNGYADNTRAVQRKARIDKFYVKKMGIQLDLYIIWRTALVILSGVGGR